MNSLIIVRNLVNTYRSRLLVSPLLVHHLRSNAFEVNCLTAKCVRHVSTSRESVCHASDASVSPTESHSSHNHSKIWSYERYLSLGLLGVIPVSLVCSLPALDYPLAVALVAHIHWGVEAIVVDYIRPSLFGRVIPRLSILALYLLSIASVGGLFYFNYTDVGLSHAIRMIAKL